MKLHCPKNQPWESSPSINSLTILLSLVAKPEHTCLFHYRADPLFYFGCQLAGPCVNRVSAFVSCDGDFYETISGHWVLVLRGAGVPAGGEDGYRRRIRSGRSSAGPEANPVSGEARLAEKWGKTENIEWAAEIPGRGWSSPIVSGDRIFVTTAVTEGESKPPQIGTEYSNEYIAELEKKGLTEAQILEKVTERDIELPKEVMLHYFLYCLNLKSGKVEWKTGVPFGTTPGRTAPEKQFRLGDAGDGRQGRCMSMSRTWGCMRLI